jgi:hypothetical protein
MPNSDDNPSSLKPWNIIDVHGPVTSEDRCKNLEEQIELLQKAMVKLDEDDGRRETLMEIAKEDKLKFDKVLFESEKDARQNDIPARKKPSKRTKPLKKASSLRKDPNETEDEGDDVDNDTAADVNEDISMDCDNEEIKADDVVKSEVIDETLEEKASNEHNEIPLGVVE